MKSILMHVRFIAVSLLAASSQAFDRINHLAPSDKENHQMKKASGVRGQKSSSRKLGISAGNAFSALYARAAGTYVAPSSSPSLSPSSAPSQNPTSSPTSRPTASPTANPTARPTEKLLDVQARSSSSTTQTAANPTSSTTNKSGKKSKKSATTSQPVQTTSQPVQTADKLQANTYSSCDETLRTMIQIADLNATTSMATAAGIILELPFYDGMTGRTLGLWQCSFTNLPHNSTLFPEGKTLHQCSYSFDVDLYASQIFVSGTSEGRTNSIIGGSGMYACAGGQEEVYLETEEAIHMQMRICSTCLPQ